MLSRFLTRPGELSLLAAAQHPLSSLFLQAQISFPVDYPYSPPAFRFLTKMWHPNIYEVTAAPQNLVASRRLCHRFVMTVFCVARTERCASPSCTHRSTTRRAESCLRRGGTPHRTSGTSDSGQPGSSSGWCHPTDPTRISRWQTGPHVPHLGFLSTDQNQSFSLLFPASESTRQPPAVGVTS